MKPPHSTSSPGLFENGRNPLAPDIAYIRVVKPDDEVVGIDVLKTVKNYSESLLPQIKGRDLRPDDILTITFDDDIVRNLKIEERIVSSHAFDSDSLRSPLITMRELSDKGPSERMYLMGSSITSWGTMLQQRTINDGQYLVTYDEEGLEHVSEGAINGLQLRRPNIEGVLEEVIPNQLEKIEASATYQEVVGHFTNVRTALSTAGLDFDDMDDATGLFVYHRRSAQDSFLQATRGGFGSAINPQDKVYLYDDERETLSALIYTHSTGALQFATVPVNPSTEYVGWGRLRTGWRYPSTVGARDFHWHSDYAPFTTYTWATPDEPSPIITVLLPANEVGSVSFIENPAVRQPQVELDITFDNDNTPRPVIRANGGTGQIDDFPSWCARIEATINIKKNNSSFTLQVGDSSNEIPLLPTAAIDRMDTFTSVILANT
jgi:hypothetical protein